jgi:hypothetical protein
VSARSLQDDLIQIPGVEGADVEGSGDTPAGLRIRIAEGADQQAVGGAIRRVLTAHGLGTDTHLPGEPSENAEGDSEVDSANVEQVTAEAPVDPPVIEEVDIESEPIVSTVAIMEDDVAPEVVDITEDAIDVVPQVDAEPEVFEPQEPEPPHEANAVARLRSVSVEEGRDGIVVTVAATDDAEVRQAAASTEGGVESAVVRATAQLARPDSPDVIVVDIEDRRVEGIDIVMIVLDIDGSMLAGSAVVGAGRAFALGRATWAALSL